MNIQYIKFMDYVLHCVLTKHIYTMLWIEVDMAMQSEFTLTMQIPT